MAGDDCCRCRCTRNVNLATDPAHAALVRNLTLLLERTWDNGHLPPAPSRPLPAGPHVQLKAAGACLLVGDASDEVNVGACEGSVNHSVWVVVAGESAHPQLASVASAGYCLNVYGRALG